MMQSNIWNFDKLNSVEFILRNIQNSLLYIYKHFSIKSDNKNSIKYVNKYNVNH